MNVKNEFLALKGILYISYKIEYHLLLKLI